MIFDSTLLSYHMSEVNQKETADTTTFYFKPGGGIQHCSQNQFCCSITTKGLLTEKPGLNLNISDQHCVLTQPNSFSLSHGQWAEALRQTGAPPRELCFPHHCYWISKWPHFSFWQKKYLNSWTKENKKRLHVCQCLWSIDWSGLTLSNTHTKFNHTAV